MNWRNFSIVMKMDVPARNSPMIVIFFLCHKIKHILIINRESHDNIRTQKRSLSNALQAMDAELFVAYAQDWAERMDSYGELGVVW